MKILIADDNALSRQMITDIVAAMGHEVASAADGPSALHDARTQMPDLLILDVEMPGLTGFEVCKLLRSDERTNRLPIIMLTAMHDPDDRVYGLDIGADDYVTKPFAPRELMARIEKRLQAKAETDELRGRQATIRRVFERFLSPPIVERLLEDPSLLKLGGELQEVTVLFADLEGFTRMSEHMDPGKVLGVLNQYHQLILNIAQQNHGTVIKFLGDGVMMLFNAPLAEKRHALKAVHTALKIHWTLADFHKQFDPKHRLKINFGIHTGQAVVGFAGTNQAMEYTTLGDTPNLAARLQDMAHNNQILISEQTHEQLGDQVAVRSVGPLHVKNRTEAVMTYEVLDVFNHDQMDRLSKVEAREES